MPGLLVRQFKQAGSGNGRTEGSGGCRLMKPALVVFGSEGNTEPHGSFGPCQVGQTQISRARIDLFGERESRRKDGDRQVPDMGEMGVVIVQRVRNRTVGKRGCPGWQSGPAEHRRTLPAALTAYKCDHLRTRRLVDPGKTANRPVEQAQVDHLQRRSRDGFGR